ncbi:IS66 family transposase [Enterobacter hormaechei subsp. xiangfangensis]|uniref:IS66 family transposase n=1 Tax=Enterobacter hormaechei TaxID=158836 RepID=UPI00266E95AF|nr:IS66 family transposase [Enterobacter hormaechei]MDQ5337015.1 IS66 family transposase [Klebsiella pneumoniae]MCU2683539.1 IS66 family transposase [Enterobacter hormaechei subsp. xiangfangensis]MCU3773730.1 IS66 family transposase [Enterobacter hormaechei subsp. xiangfangensis]MCU3788036.1 IS66 family transposase [Enterobacter hormaechei subsp. xiangfangensis]MDQ5390865.1 IS66 family transposase [Klebsiella pneumoniae]
MKMTPKNLTPSPDLSGLSAAELLAVIAGFQQQLALKDEALQSKEEAIQRRDAHILLLEELLRLRRIQRFAASSEKLHQLQLFDEAELEADMDALLAQLPDDLPQTAEAKAKPRQRGFSASLLRERIELTLSDEQKAGASKVFFTKVKEELQFIPAQLKVLEIWQEKAVFERDGEEVILAANRPVHPLGKCIATPSLLGYIITSKYADGLPLYRLEQMFKRLGQEVSRTNMAHWIIRLDEVFQPLMNLLREEQNLATYLQADETRIQVLKEEGKTAQSDKWMWVTRGGPPGRPSVLFEYDPSRAGSIPVRLLDGFSGVLQADGYSGYSQVCKQSGLTRIGCWDHARRKFIEATQATPSVAKGKSKPGASKADVALGYIGKLYAIEREQKERSDAERYQARQTRSVPLLAELKTWLENNVGKVMKGSLTRKAMEYTLGQWPYLVGYCERGDLHISNVLAENAIRPFAVGRKAWLFADSAQGAKASATCYSLLETAKANDLEPSAYINHVLAQIGEADTLEKLEALLPWNVPLEPIAKKVAQYNEGK